MKEKEVSNTEIIEALELYGNATLAAKMLGISRQTIYNRRKSQSFRAEEVSRQADAIRERLIDLNELEKMATNTLQQILCDPEVNPAIRLQAGQSIMKTAGEYRALLAKLNEQAAVELGVYEIHGFESFKPQEYR